MWNSKVMLGIISDYDKQVECLNNDFIERLLMGNIWGSKLYTDTIKRVRLKQIKLVWRYEELHL